MMSEQWQCSGVSAAIASATSGCGAIGSAIPSRPRRLSTELGVGHRLSP